ncbi:hypothetical protein F8O01_16335 [Pseudoclavibacter chungangensis]|uniref:ESX-1 secretion-associated protein n=1 Tax=Pseudoclavibacter chungangensis TaxID=587635 RepID=A0A7J5BQ06_9MICO|nr:DUF6507 family protein [Pseudoclavibacter chungangensis]KAB1652749.1 hypothetical protein F8O01_16335 [Pseudoclavibacter chungangensis]NYJ68027.1 hypothetical protein [Pseudoclavibacter chungangensis]
MTNSFEIKPAELSTVLGNVKTQLDEFSDGIDGDALQTDVSGLAEAGAPGVAQALAEFLELESPRIKSIGDRIAACLAGAALVGNTYTTSSDEMLQNVQSQAASSADNGDFSYFNDAS